VSPLDPELPPVGEEIHLPGPSIQPFLLALGIACFIVGLTWKTWLLIGGAVLAVVVIIVWIRDAGRELDSLPAEHRH
jgi:membrane protein implicated in regulation of membrane protease activity